jgi:hypothetical protein
MADRQAVRLRVLLEQRHWRNHRTFCVEYEKAALSVDPRLRGTAPSRAQLYRWLSGELSGLPYGDHCRVLEKMFPEWSAKQLFESVSADEVPCAMVNRPSVAGREETLRYLDVGLTEENSQLVIGKNCDVTVAGIAKFYPDFVDVGADWEALFASSPVLDVTIMYGATWRNTYRKHLQAMARRPGGRIRVVLPDPSADSASIQAYAQTIGVASDDFRGRVQAAIADFSSMEPRRHVEVYLTAKVFRHAVYLFADHAVLAFYALCGERISTPALLVAEGELLSFLRLDFDCLIEHSDRVF